jgi:hypothetical protein
LHDIADLDGRGIPGGMVLTTAFETAAKTQSEAIGFAPGLVYVPHPIQDRTAEELNNIADNAINEILTMISRC